MSDITLAEAVDQLKDYTAEEIVELLTLAGKTGSRSDEQSCPMAHYLYDVMGHQCVVSNHEVWVYGSSDWQITLPGGVQHFITEFDSGVYPHLIAGEDADWGTEDE